MDKVIMCPPTYYDIKEVINPWMREYIGKIDRERANDQWLKLYETLMECNVKRELCTATEELTEQVFISNAGFISEKLNIFIYSTLKHRIRWDESVALASYWYANHPLRNGGNTTHGIFEGEGDLVKANNLLVYGYGQRSERTVFDQLRILIDIPILPVQLDYNTFYHLDTAFCPLKNGYALWFPTAFSRDSRELLHKYFRLIDVGLESCNLACNSIVTNDTVIINKGCPRTVEKLHELGYETVSLDLSEFNKSGAGPHCLVLSVD